MLLLYHIMLFFCTPQFFTYRGPAAFFYFEAVRAAMPYRILCRGMQLARRYERQPMSKENHRHLSHLPELALPHHEMTPKRMHEPSRGFSDCCHLEHPLLIFLLSLSLVSTTKRAIFIQGTTHGLPH